MTVLAAASYALISLYRHDHFGSDAFDLGIQDQTVWGYSRFEFIYNTVVGIPNLLGDHFHPILTVLAPFYWMWNSAGVLLVAQAILLALAGVPIYLWAEQVLGRFAGLAFQAAYLVFWGILAGVLFDFHHVAFAVPAVAVALYATLTRRNGLLWVAVAVAMLTREDVALTLGALGVYILAFQRRWALGAVLVGLNAAWFALLIGLIIPALGGGVPYRHWLYDALGSGPAGAGLYVVRHPLSALQLLFTPAEKTRVWVGSFLAFLLLPLASPLLVVALPSFLERFWSSSPDLWSFHFQYSLLAAPILAFAAIDTCARLKSLLRGWMATIVSTVLPGGALVMSALLSFVLVRPLAELSTYVSDATAAQIQSCLDVIPPDASVSATYSLVPHLAHRPQIYVLPGRSDMSYIAIDLSSYQSIPPGIEDELRTLVRSSLAADYSVACAEGLTLVLGPAGSTAQLTPELQRWLAGECSGSRCLLAAASAGDAHRHA
jgi:uncharacterized membrane protein